MPRLRSGNASPTCGNRSRNESTPLKRNWPNTPVRDALDAWLASEAAYAPRTRRRSATNPRTRELASKVDVLERVDGEAGSDAVGALMCLSLSSPRRGERERHEIPLIDIAGFATTKSLGRALLAAARDIGFFVVTGRHRADNDRRRLA